RVMATTQATKQTTKAPVDAIDRLEARPRAVGAQTLVGQRREEPEPDVAPPVGYVRSWVNTFFDAAFMPLVDYALTEGIVACAPPDQQARLRPLALMVVSTSRPALTVIPHRLVDVRGAPRALRASPTF